MINLVGHTEPQPQAETSSNAATGQLLLVLDTLMGEWLRDGLPEPSLSDNIQVLALGFCPDCSEPVFTPAGETCATPERHISKTVAVLQPPRLSEICRKSALLETNE